MKKIILATALLTISVTAHAGTYSVEGVTVHVQDGCRSSSCVSVYAPGYGSYHEGRSVKVHKSQKDPARFASAAKEDKAAPVAPAAAPAAEAAPAKAPEAAQATPSDSAPAK
jgi:hypothetical protein